MVFNFFEKIICIAHCDLVTVKNDAEVAAIDRLLVIAECTTNLSYLRFTFKLFQSLISPFPEKRTHAEFWGREMGIASYVEASKRIWAHGRGTKGRARTRTTYYTGNCAVTGKVTKVHLV